jgi:mRNA interferase RelE/StbE
VETIGGSIAANPYRAGKPLEEPFGDYHSARRGTYRIIYRIDEAKQQVEIHSIRHRRDAYRAQLARRESTTQNRTARVEEER